MAAFLVRSDGTKVAIEDGMIVGRVKGCALVIEDAKISRRHARLISSGGVVEVEDLKSSNGTLMNGHRITKRMLRDGKSVKAAAKVEFGEDVKVMFKATPAEKAPLEPISIIFEDDHMRNTVKGNEWF